MEGEEVVEDPQPAVEEAVLEEQTLRGEVEEEEVVEVEHPSLEEVEVGEGEEECQKSRAGRWWSPECPCPTRRCPPHPEGQKSPGL